MTRIRITCPQSAHLEEIDCENTPFGLLIEGCSRFSPRCAVDCDRDCARRLDRRDRRSRDDCDERVLVVVPPFDAAAGRLADALAAVLRSDGFTVERADADRRTAPPPPDYDAIVLGSATHGGQLHDSLLAYIATYRDLLDAMPAFLFGIGGWPAISWPAERVAVFSENSPATHVFVWAFAEAISDEVPIVGSDFANASHGPGA